MRVTVYGRERLMGVIGAKAPHLLSAADREKNYAREDLYVDLGMSAQRVRELVQIGDCIALEGGFTKLLNDRYASKTIDDRGCVAILLRTMEALQRIDTQADLYFVASCQEEVGSIGAMTSAYGIYPDFAVALDVNHAKTPGSPDLETFDLGSPLATMGPFIHPMLRRRAWRNRQGKQHYPAIRRRPALYLYRCGQYRPGPRRRAIGAAGAAAQVHAHLSGNL